MTRSTVVDGAGVEMAGPDTPGLQQAEADTGNLVVTRESGQMARVLMNGGASVGRVDPRQAGILPMQRMPVTEEMVRRAQQAGADEGRLLEAYQVRAMLEAALQG